MPPLKRVSRDKKQKKQQQKVDEQPPEDSRPPAPAAILTEAQAPDSMPDSLPSTSPGRDEGSPQAWVEVRTPQRLEDQQTTAEPTQTSTQTSTSISTSSTVAVGKPVGTDNEDFLVDWFRDRPFFYNQRDPDFKNRQKKDRLLAEVGAKLGLSGPDVGRWFKSMRNVYGKWLRHGKSGQADESLTPRQQWTLKSFKFLDEHMRVQSSSLTLGRVSITPLISLNLNFTFSNCLMFFF